MPHIEEIVNDTKVMKEISPDHVLVQVKLTRITNARIELLAAKLGRNTADIIGTAVEVLNRLEQDVSRGGKIFIEDVNGGLTRLIVPSFGKR